MTIRATQDIPTQMRDLLNWLMAIAIVGAAATVYWKNRSTTYRTADGACQSLTVEDECY